ncbi:MAG: VOC family protein [Acidobacteriota bacterium]|nr:VOC family protein [Acidobacteriota bacterium]
MSVKPIPEGYHTVTPSLIVRDAAKLIDFMREAFDAKEIIRFDDPEGKVAHAEVKIGDSMLMIGEANAEFPPSQSMIHLYVENADAVYESAIKAGAETVKELVDQFYGDRSGCVKDSFGNLWWIGTHIEDVPMEEMHQRIEAYMQQAQAV